MAFGVSVNCGALAWKAVALDLSFAANAKIGERLFQASKLPNEDWAVNTNSSE